MPSGTLKYWKKTNLLLFFIKKHLQVYSAGACDGSAVCSGAEEGSAEGVSWGEAVSAGLTVGSGVGVGLGFSDCKV